MKYKWEKLAPKMVEEFNKTGNWRATCRKYVPECESKHAKKMVMKYGGFTEVKENTKFIKGE